MEEPKNENKKHFACIHHSTRSFTIITSDVFAHFGRNQPQKTGDFRSRSQQKSTIIMKI